MPSSDTVVADRYALQSPLGHGAMGTVWRAQDQLLKRDVAVKEIDIPAGFDPAERAALEARVLREARAAARLAHPGAVSVFDVVEHHERPWIVMEFVDAPTLEERVESSGPLTVSHAAKIGIDLLDVLEVAHAAGIVHRDVKPGNVMCADDGTVKLADFGIASIADDPKITQTGLVLGSPSFMAPEQATTGVSGPEADLWSLGATLYFAVEGVPPFDKGAAVPTLTAVMGDEPRPMTRAGQMEPVILRLLAKDPSQRLALVEAKGQLARISAGEATTRAQPVSGSTPATAVLTGRTPAAAAAPRPTPTRRPAPGEITGTGDKAATRWLPWVALALGLAALVAVPMILNSSEDPAPSERERREDRATAPDDGDGDTATGEDAPDAQPDPANWTSTTDETAGHTVHYPVGWEIVPRDAGTTDYVDPATGTYLRVAWTDEPGHDVMQRLEEIAASFAAENGGYSEFQMTPTEYQGHEAGLWEYAYEEDGAALHAYNLQFVIGEEYGYALNFQTHEEDWESSQDLWEQLQGSFEPPS